MHRNMDKVKLHVIYNDSNEHEAKVIWQRLHECTAHSCAAWQTDWQTNGRTPRTSVTIVCILRIRCSLKSEITWKVKYYGWNTRKSTKPVLWYSSENVTKAYPVHEATVQISLVNGHATLTATKLCSCRCCCGHCERLGWSVFFWDR